MFRQTKKVLVGIAALAALALGGSALAQAGNPPAKPVGASTATSATNETTTAPDTNNVQSGDQSTPDTGNVQSGDQSTSDTTGADEKDSASENPETQAEQPETLGDTTGSETPGNDGPAGHADEPGNAGADHQFEGQE